MIEQESLDSWNCFHLPAGRLISFMSRLTQSHLCTLCSVELFCRYNHELALNYCSCATNTALQCPQLPARSDTLLPPDFFVLLLSWLTSCCWHAAISQHHWIIIRLHVRYVFILYMSDMYNLTSVICLAPTYWSKCIKFIVGCQWFSGVLPKP